MRQSTGPLLVHAGIAPGNEETAQLLDEAAALLEAQHANPFRSMAYRRAASAVRQLAWPVSEVATGGTDTLMAALDIGERLARTIAEIVETGRLRLLDRLRGETDPEAVIATIAGMGPQLARRVHEDLGIATLEELEIAAHDGRLSTVRGFGRRRIRAVIDALAARLAGRKRHAVLTPAHARPSVAEILDVDRQYRGEAAAGVLRRIAPRRFNPQGRAWLPILHAERGDRHYTALFSNTARAHASGRVGDWVVIYLDDGDAEWQATVVTERRGALAGRRVVRGRERECAEHYAARSARRSRRVGREAAAGPTPSGRTRSLRDERA
jgi:hypothetical protein